VIIFLQFNQLYSQEINTSASLSYKGYKSAVGITNTFGIRSTISFTNHNNNKYNEFVLGFSFRYIDELFYTKNVSPYYTGFYPSDFEEDTMVYYPFKGIMGAFVTYYPLKTTGLEHIFSLGYTLGLEKGIFKRNQSSFNEAIEDALNAFNIGVSAKYEYAFNFNHRIIFVPEFQVNAIHFLKNFDSPPVIKGLSPFTLSLSLGYTYTLFSQ
jgi:hypothetical protein